MKLWTTMKSLNYAVIGLAVLTPIVSIATECEVDARCVVVLGNSITRHGPSSEIGWTGNWGMAATAAEKDYVSQLLKLLTEISKGRVWKADRFDGVLLERDPQAFKLPDNAIQLAKNADVVIVELGDNFTSDASNNPAFSEAHMETLKSLRPHNGILACVSTWWTSRQKNKIIKENCRSAGGVYVDISGLSESPENVAGSERKIAHQGVAAHPGDKGMAAIAERILGAIRGSISQ